jgi:predicted 3-demethylubiquinone-9 3-methyltransferase (glyoxalase superfamily)
LTNRSGLRWFGFGTEGGKRTQVERAQEVEVAMRVEDEAMRVEEGVIRVEEGAPRVEHASKIGPCLWFDAQAEQAADFYVKVFSARRATAGDGGESKILGISRYGEAGPGPAGTVMTVDFLLEGQEFVALNGGPEFSFTPAISFIVNCETQDEVDGLWETLSQGGTQGECGWLEDKFGVSWQIVPTALGELLADPDPARTQRVMRAMLEMRKLDIAGLERAAEAV